MITVLFSCDACGLKDIPTEVRAREDHEDVVEYVRKVIMQAIMEKHLRLSLLCEAKSVQNIKIPYDKDDPNGWIGKQTSLIPPNG